MFETYTPTELILVDVETNGIDFERHELVECAWRNYQTGEHGCFVPPHNVRDVLANAAVGPKALKVNGYIERELWHSACWDRDNKELLRLWEQFVGEEPEDPRDLEEWGPLPKRIFLSVNPAFDAHFVAKLFRADEICSGDRHSHRPEPQWRIPETTGKRWAPGVEHTQRLTATPPAQTQGSPR